MADRQDRSECMLQWLMKRPNTFAVRPVSDTGEQPLRDLLDASPALWNEVNYQRLMRYNDEDGFEGDVWDADTGQLEGKYKDVLGASTAQQVIRKNSEAWRRFFRPKDQYHDESNTSVTEHPEPPGFRGNEDDGRQLKTVIRNTSYTVEWGDRSRLEILVGSELKDRYDHTGRLRLEIAGNPNWPDYDKQGRLYLWYDETDCTFRASQPVTVSDDTRDTPLAGEKAALDSGTNDLVACTTTTGEQYLYEGRDLFARFRETTREIARLQSKLEDGRYSCERIRRLYRKRTHRRDHALTNVPKNSAQTRVPPTVTGMLLPGKRHSRDSHGGNPVVDGALRRLLGRRRLPVFTSGRMSYSQILVNDQINQTRTRSVKHGC